MIWTYFQTTNAFLHHTKKHAKCICENICIEDITADRHITLYTQSKVIDLNENINEQATNILGTL